MAPPQPQESIINEPTLSVDRYEGNVFVLTMKKKPENRIDSAYAQKLISAYNTIRKIVGENADGAVITRGSDEKFWCTGLVLDELDHDPSANSSGFFPLLACLLDYPLPTIALLTGHTFGGACPFALAHDYRLMNSQRGYISMPPVNLGLHFPGIGSLLRLKLAPKTARKMLLEAHKWTGVEAEKEGIVDFVVEPGRMLEEALEWGRKVAPRARMGVFSLLRNELYGEAGRAFREISYVYGRRTGREAKAKI